MKSLSVLFVLFAAPAAAHTGHIAEVAGHDHWVAGIALGAAAAIALWAVIKSKGKDEKAEDSEEAEAEPSAEAQES